jgi:hypothetical protein
MLLVSTLLSHLVEPISDLMQTLWVLHSNHALEALDLILGYHPFVAECLNSLLFLKLSVS